MQNKKYSRDFFLFYFTKIKREEYYFFLLLHSCGHFVGDKLLSLSDNGYLMLISVRNVNKLIYPFRPDNPTFTEEIACILEIINDELQVINQYYSCFNKNMQRLIKELFIYILLSHTHTLSHKHIRASSAKPGSVFVVWALC